MRKARSALGGSGGNGGIVTKTLVGINVAVFLLGLVLAGSGAIGGFLTGDNTLLHVYGSLIPAPAKVQVGSEIVLVNGVAGGDYYRLLTSMFLHYGVLHLLFNMYILWIIGRYLERELGPIRYLALYLVSGLGGSVLTYLLAAPNSATAGASGCIFGLFGAMVLINRRLGRDNSGIYVLLGLNLVITFLPGMNISWTGHVGGLLTGAALGAVLAHAPRQSRSLVQTAAFVVVIMVFAGLVVWRTNQILGSLGGVA